MQGRTLTFARPVNGFGTNLLTPPNCSLRRAAPFLQSHHQKPSPRRFLLTPRQNAADLPRSLRFYLCSQLRNRRAATAPSAHAPKKEAEERQPAQVHAQRVTELVIAAGIVAGIDSDIIPNQQIWHGQRHESPLHQPAREARGSCSSLAAERFRPPPMQAAKANRQPKRNNPRVSRDVVLVSVADIATEQA